MMELCTHLFDRLVSENWEGRAKLLHKDRAVVVEGWCPECGSLITPQGHKIAPSKDEWVIRDGVQSVDVG